MRKLRRSMRQGPAYREDHTDREQLRGEQPADDGTAKAVAEMARFGGRQDPVGGAGRHGGAGLC
jgi:hypothetical protein